MNSLLQTLFHAESFRELVLRFEAPEGEDPSGLGFSWFQSVRCLGQRWGGLGQLFGWFVNVCYTVELQGHIFVFG